MPEPAADSRLSVDDGPEVELKEKGSRFVGQIFRADEEASALARLTAVRKRYHAATHHVSAWRVGPPGALLEKCDDDGEPSGTSGAPILALLQGEAIHDAVAIVTRWYGGTKLGRGGLVRAYGDTARLALDAAPRRTIFREAIVTIECGYDVLGVVEAILARETARIRTCERDFGGEPRFRVVVLASEGDGLRERIIEATAGRARVTIDISAD